jgi:hypothetical protein
MNMVELVRIAGATSVCIDAEITENGDLQISGQDIGAAPQEMFGDVDYEYWLRIAAADKDRLLLALIEQQYSGNAKVVSKLRHFLGSKGIYCGFFSYLAAIPANLPIKTPPEFAI